VKTMSKTPDEMPDNATDRPLVTFALFAYNQEEYIREAIEGAFAQTYEPLEIILSDDCSNDRTFNIMEEMAAAYEGPHYVRVRQNKMNLGLAGHINIMIADAAGSIVSWAAGDDIAEPDRTEIFVAKLQEDEKNVGVHSDVEEIDQEGRHLKVRRHLGERVELSLRNVTRHGLSVISQSHAFRKQVFEHFGPLSENVTNEGIVMAFREAAIGKIVFVDQPLTKYRMGSGTSTYAGAELKRRKEIEPIKITGWYLSAFQQMQKDATKLARPLAINYQKEIECNFKFYTSLMEINTGAAFLRPLYKNFLVAPRDKRSLRAVIRRSLPASFYRLLST
jgi:glycosyltransferase involved in cell wall biosynthesis